MHWHRDLIEWVLPLGGQSRPSIGVYDLCKTCGGNGTYRLSATVVLLSLSTPTSCTTSTPHHWVILTLMLTVWDGRAILTPPIGTSALTLEYYAATKVLVQDPLIPHHHHLHNPNQTCRVSWSNSERLKLRLMKLLVRQSIRWPPSLMLWQLIKRRLTPKSYNRLAIWI